MHCTFYESIKQFRWHEMKMMKYAQFFAFKHSCVTSTTSIPNLYTVRSIHFACVEKLRYN